MKAAKATLRKEISAKLKQLSEDEVSRQTNNVMLKLFQDPIFNSGQKISVYLSMKLEIGTLPIIQRIFEQKKQCFVPKYSVGGSLMEMVQLHSLDDYHSLPTTKWNIKQPAADDKRPDALQLGGLDLIIAPGVAFTTGGKRLGHGRGYYDSYLNKCNSTRKTYVIGLCLKEQIVDDLPTTESDVNMDKVYFG